MRGAGFGGAAERLRAMPPMHSSSALSGGGGGGQHAAPIAAWGMGAGQPGGGAEKGLAAAKSSSISCVRCGEESHE